MTPADIQQALRQVLIEERLMSAFRSGIPEPSDVEAERVVLGALIAGEVDGAVADGLQPEHFYLPLHRWAFTRWLEGARGDTFQAAAESEGYTGPGISRELDDLRWQPVVMVPPMTTFVQRIQEAAHRRALCSACERVAMKLKAGSTVAEVTDELVACITIT